MLAYRKPLKTLSNYVYFFKGNFSFQEEVLETRKMNIGADCRISLLGDLEEAASLEFDLHEQFTLYMPGTLLRA
jgi:hypothetical protein